MDRLKGRVAIVTGAGRTGNIGVAVCHAFVREGAAGVVGTDLRTDDADRIREQIGSDCFRLLAHDVTDADSWRRIVRQTVEVFGGLDILVNNAGMSIHGSIESTALADLRQVMAVNHDALFLGIKACAPELAKRAPLHPGGAAIINTLSMGSYVGNPRNVSYHVSKAAARMLTMCAAKELAPKGIRVNSVHPGVTMTPLMRDGCRKYVEEGVWESLAAGEAALAAMKKLNITSRPEDLAHAFVYLASDEARFVTGIAFQHDGSCELY